VFIYLHGDNRAIITSEPYHPVRLASSECAGLESRIAIPDRNELPGSAVGSTGFFLIESDNTNRRRVRTPDSLERTVCG
jgi:hypothetical protein